MKLGQNSWFNLTPTQPGDDPTQSGFDFEIHPKMPQVGVLASEGWREAWQPFRKVTRRLLVRDKVGILQVSLTFSALGVFHLMRYINVRYLLTYLGWVSPRNVINLFPSALRQCWLGDRKVIWPVKNWVLSLVTIWLELCMSYSSNCHHYHGVTFIILSSNIIQNGDILVPAYPGFEPVSSFRTSVFGSTDLTRPSYSSLTCPQPVKHCRHVYEDVMTWPESTKITDPVT